MFSSLIVYEWKRRSRVSWGPTSYLFSSIVLDEWGSGAYRGSPLLTLFFPVWFNHCPFLLCVQRFVTMRCDRRRSRHWSSTHKFGRCPAPLRSPSLEMRLASIFLLVLVSVATSYADNLLLQDDSSLAQEDYVTDGSFVARVLGRIAQKKRNNRRDPSNDDKESNNKAMKVQKSTMNMQGGKNMNNHKVPSLALLV